MNIPENGRVVVIDDVIKEALPLIQALSRHRIPVTYFDGELDTLPDEPIEEVRIVFLDIVLGTEVQDEKSRISKVVGVLNKIVGDKNGPYLIIIWTKHHKLIDELNKNMVPRYFVWVMS